jgi:hypothetical protein
VSAAVSLNKADSAARRHTRSHFFLGISIVMFAIVIVGFAPTLYLRAFFDVPEIPSHLYVHGAVLTTWYAWFVVQTSSVALGRTDLHRRFGIFGAALGTAVVLASATTSLRFGPRLAERGVDVETRLHFLSEIVWGNIQSLTCFSVLLIAAIVMRARAQSHKRLMLLASMSILPPAITRIIDWPIWGFGNNAMLPLLCCLAVFPIALGMHDLTSAKSLHPITLTGGLAIVVSFAISVLVLPNTEWGRSVVYGLYNLMR